MLRYLGLLVVGIIFGMFGVMIHWNAEMFGSYGQVFVRNGIALGFLLPIIILIRQIDFSLVTRKSIRWLVLYGAMVAFSFTFITLAFTNAEIKTVLSVRYLTTILAAFFTSVVILREQTNFVGFSAALLACVGISIFAWPFDNFVNAGVIFASLAAATFLVSNYIIKQVDLQPELIMLVEFTSVTALVGIFIGVTNTPITTGFSYLSLISVVCFGALLILVTYLIIAGFRKTNFNIANIVMVSEMFFGVLFGYLLLNQGITLVESVGISLIFVAAVLPSIYGLFVSREAIR